MEEMESLLSNFGINSAQTLSEAIVKATDASQKQNRSNSILLSVYLFGSVYLFSTSLGGMNKMWIQDKRNTNNRIFFMMNGGVLVVSGALMVHMASKAWFILR
jgi:hypothetical protein